MTAPSRTILNAHRQQHADLHRALQTLVGDFVVQKGVTLADLETVPLSALYRWSLQQSKQPTGEFKA